MTKVPPERVGELLRELDLAAGAALLSPSDAARLRQAMLRELAATSTASWSPFGWRTALAGAAAAGLLLAFGLLRLALAPEVASQASGPTVATRPSVTQARTDRPRPDVPDAPTVPTVEATIGVLPVAPAVPPVPAESPASRERHAPATVLESPEAVANLSDTAGNPPVEEAPAQLAAVDEPRQLQMTTPGGTRVVWILHSDPIL